MWQNPPLCPDTLGLQGYNTMSRKEEGNAMGNFFWIAAGEGVKTLTLYIAMHKKKKTKNKFDYILFLFVNVKFNSNREI